MIDKLVIIGASSKIKNLYQSFKKDEPKIKRKMFVLINKK
jgi:hypothetical protein